MENGKWKMESGKWKVESGKLKLLPTFSIFHFPFSIIKGFPFSIYSAILRKRIALYESGAFKSFSLGARTVSVGNLTVGGTGKTPLVAFAARVLADDGEKVCVISRGYKRANPKQKVLVSDGEKFLTDARLAGDEPFELARKLLGRAIVVADADRVRAANWARERFEITAFVLDDAFQHLRARRDLDIVVVDATNPFGNGKLLPFGILREPPDGLKRADAVVITRANLVETIEDLKAEIRKFNAACPIFVSENRISKLTELKDFHRAAETRNSETENQILKTKNRNSKFLAFCALGNPRNFYAQLERENYNIIGTETFPDHYFYRQSDIVKLEKKARAADAEALLTTAKDAVKLKDLQFRLPCLVAESEMIFDEKDEFSRWLVKQLTVISQQLSVNKRTVN